VTPDKQYQRILTRKVLTPSFFTDSAEGVRCFATDEKRQEKSNWKAKDNEEKLVGKGEIREQMSIGK